MVKGSVILVLSSLLAKVLGAIYRIPLAGILGSQGIGLYQMVFPIYSMLLVFVTSGVTTTISKKVAGFRAEGDYNQITKTVQIGIVISLFLGLIFAVLLYFFKDILSTLQGNSLAASGYSAIAIGFAFSCVLSAFRGYFQGYENMAPTAVSQTVEQLVKLALGLWLSATFIKDGISQAVFGALLGVSIGEIVSFVLLLIWFVVGKKKRNLKSQSTTNSPIAYKNFIKTALPISLYSIISPLSIALDSLIVINLLSFAGFTQSFGTMLYGVYSGMVMPIVNLPIILVSAISVCLLPKISYNCKMYISSQCTASSVYKVVFAFVLPCSIGLMLLAPNVMALLYPQTDFFLQNVAVQLFIFLSVYIIFVSLSSVAVTTLQAYGHFRYPLVIMLIGSAIKVVLTIILLQIPQINIIGIAVAQCIAMGFVCAFNLYKAKKITGLNLSYKTVIKIAACTLFMATAVYGTLKLFASKSPLLSTAAAVCTGVLVYAALVLLTKTFTIKELLQKKQ